MIILELLSYLPFSIENADDDLISLLKICAQQNLSF